MSRHAYCAFYDGTPTVSDALRSTKSDDEIRGLLSALPSYLAGHFSQDAKVEASEIQRSEVRGVTRLARLVTVFTAMDKPAAIDRIERAFNELHLFGERML